jgi:hypothetical protein
MGVQVAITLDDQLKPDYVVSTVAAGSFAVLTTQCILFVGASWAGSLHEQVSAVKRCGELIRENGTKTPLTTNQSYAKTVAPALKSQVLIAFDAVAALPDEEDIGIWYGSAFQPLVGSSITAHVKRALEKYLETTQKKL